MDYQSLGVWKLAMDLCEEVYRVTDAFPRREMFGLTAQIRDCATSIPSNIAEGEGRVSRGEKLQFLRYARGSLFELETRLVIARRVGYAPPEPMFRVLREVRGLLNSYIAYVTRQGG